MMPDWPQAIPMLAFGQLRHQAAIWRSSRVASLKPFGVIGRFVHGTSGNTE
jgi:hypothetical protein